MTTKYYWDITNRYVISPNLSSYSEIQQGNRLKCIKICSKNTKCSLIYLDLNQNLCKFYKTFFANDFLIAPIAKQMELFINGYLIRIYNSYIK